MENKDQLNQNAGTPREESQVENSLNTVQVPQTEQSQDVQPPVSDDAKSENTVDDSSLVKDEEVSEEVDEQYYHDMSRQQLVDILSELVEQGDIMRLKSHVSLIRSAFLDATQAENNLQKEEETGEDEASEENKKPEDKLLSRFNGLYGKYRDMRTQYFEEQERIKKNNLADKNTVLEELRELINSEENLKKTYDEFKVLQDKWKVIGAVPKAEANDLWQNYHFLIEKFFDKVKINKELRDLDLKKNLEQKIEICEKAEALILETSIIKSFKALQDLHQEWREIGPVSQDKKDEVWERFKDATDKINQRRREHYEKLHAEQEENLKAKTALCEKSEELLAVERTSLKEWQEGTDQMSDLLKMWKTIGRAPQKENDTIWEKFKISLDAFFATKKDFFNQLKDRQLNNYNQKLALVKQAEALKDSTEWKSTTRDLIDLQKQWKEIGPVPKKHSDKIWKRFRAACDDFFNAKSEFFADVTEKEKENLIVKEAILTELQALEISENKNENLEKLKQFQRRWMDAGHVPMKDKDRVQQAFRGLINEYYDQLKVNAVEMAKANFRDHMENLKDDPDAGKKMSRERQQLQNRISKMKEDINLWENNIGFFSKSRKANLLRDEFEKKIGRAKQELSLLQTKMKMLNKIDD